MVLLPEMWPHFHSSSQFSSSVNWNKIAKWGQGIPDYRVPYFCLDKRNNRQAKVDREDNSVERSIPQRTNGNIGPLIRNHISSQITLLTVLHHQYFHSQIKVFFQVGKILFLWTTPWMHLYIVADLEPGLNVWRQQYWYSKCSE